MDTALAGGALAGSGGLLAIVGLCGLLCVFGIRCSTAVANDVHSYAAAHSSYPQYVRRVLPSFYYKCMRSPWRYYSLVFSSFQRHRFIVEGVDLSITAMILGVAAGTHGALCRGMTVTAAGVFVLSACIVFALRTYRRPMDR